MQCHKRFYLNRFHKNLANPEEEQAQAIFQTGTKVGLLAQQLFPGGINAQGEEEWHSEKTAKRTQLREDLLAYFHLDTLAMVRIWERVEGILIRL
jgi:hypothetical protein